MHITFGFFTLTFIHRDG